MQAFLPVRNGVTPRQHSIIDVTAATPCRRLVCSQANGCPCQDMVEQLNPTRCLVVLRGAGQFGTAVNKKWCSTLQTRGVFPLRCYASVGSGIDALLGPGIN